ncbi:MAG TPA: alpha/beta fold hydrolase [Pyrinomonadaceae bacterium]|jgi:dipeptidyl aminopeptidase/acylaminoacyl peptidase|nr:alpha/beta fold hydrolase [Pyrinomonadaceae bacterium]
MKSFSRKSLVFVFAVLCLGLLTTARVAFGQPGTQPPVIDRELFFGDPEISGAQISPDGKFIAFVKPFKGTRNVWVKRTEEPFEAAKPITADKSRPVTQYFWSRDGKYILFVQDKAGDENYLVYAVNPAERPAAGEDVPLARNLTDVKGVRAAIYAVPRSDPDAIYIGLNDRDKAWHDLYKVKISTGERTLVRKNTERITGWVFDLKDQLRLATRAADNGDTEVLRVDDSGFTKVYSCNVFESCGPVRYHKDGQRVYFLTNKGANIDLQRLELFDPTNGKEELVEADPMNRVDFGNANFSEVTDDLIATSYDDDRERIYWKDKSFEADYKLLQKKLPGKEIGFGSGTKDERLYLITAGGDTEPGERYLFDRNTKKLVLQYRIREKLNRDYLASMTAIRYKSSDGLEIPAYLTLPKGVAAKNLPAIILPHGGPWGRDSWGYNGFAQFLANRGYAVLQPNFRASTGYGKKFLDAGNKQWGDKMQDDVTWGAKYLVAQGIADSKRIGIMGGSYGGYATLAGVTFTPDLYAAAVDIVGPSNLVTLLETIPPYWEPIRKLFYARMGDPATPDGKAQLERQSPLNHAAKIKTPLLVIQGANDPRVNKREADQIVIALRDRNYPVEYLVAPDEGHGFARPVNNMAMFATTEKFLAKYLGGRYQETMTPEVAQRLKEISVDVTTVALAKKLEPVAAGAPKPVAGLRVGVVNYKASIALGGQNIPLALKTETKEENGSWVVTDNVTTPNGDITGTATIEKGTLVLKHRVYKQGPVEFDVDFKDNKATGTMTMNGQSKPIALDLGGDVFGDGPGGYDAIAALPLAEGYVSSFRNMDMENQKLELKTLKVAGVESVTVPAGTFDAYKVEITTADNDADRTTLWIAKDSRKVVKMSIVLTQLNGAILTTELTQ